MTFTSSVLLFGLLPWFVLIFHWLRKHKNCRKILIIFANSVYYVWGGAGAFIILICYSLVVWAAHCLILRRKEKPVLVGSIIIAAIPLLTVKYLDFVIDNINAVLGTAIKTHSLIVPIGISFFTFEAVSFICDTYRGTIKHRASVFDTYLYLSFFPTVTSGPIIRFADIQEWLGKENNISIDFEAAVERMIIGLAKKLLIADRIAVVADYYFNGVADGNAYSICGLWIGSIAYSLQLYFDFSGYSDIAIGIGQLLGFRIRENFNKPYLATSISDFWKKWHISLTMWFKDYVYIPLGGNRCKAPRHIMNMLIVWLVTGIWHGADWTFIIWGLAYFVLLAGEKYIGALKNINRHWYCHIYTLFFVNLLWIPFRASDLSTAGKYIAGMFGAYGNLPIEERAIRFLPLLPLSALFCLPWGKYLQKLKEQKLKTCGLVKSFSLLLIAGLIICAVVNSTYAPYIYGNF